MCIHRGCIARPYYFGMGCCSYGSRGFITVEEEVKLLEEYRRRLQEEMKAVEERIRELKGRK